MFHPRKVFRYLFMLLMPRQPKQPIQYCLGTIFIPVLKDGVVLSGIMDQDII